MPFNSILIHESLLVYTLHHVKGRLKPLRDLNDFLPLTEIEKIGTYMIYRIRTI